MIGFFIKKGVIIISFLSLSLFLSCGKEAATVDPATITTTAVGSEPGYYYPSEVDVYPANLATNVPKNTSVIIVFNIPIDPLTLTLANITVTGSSLGLLDGTQYTISSTPSTIALITFTGTASPLPANETITVTYTGGIQDLDRGIGLSNPGSFSFTTGADIDSTSPSVLSINPSGGAEPLTTVITVQFAGILPGDIDPTTINSSTIYVTGGGSTVETAYAYSSATNIATLTPTSHLLSGVLYTVTVKKTGSNLISDLSGNVMTGVDQTQTFTTTGTLYDPYGINPSILAPGPVVTGVNITSAWITWSTDHPTNHTFRYGTNDTTSSSVTDPAFNPFHGVNLGALSPGKRYWISMNNTDFQNSAGYVGVAGFTNIQFNTVTPEVPVNIHAGASGQYLLSVLPQKFLVANSGNFLFWHDNSAVNAHIYGQLYDSTLVTLWNGGSPNPVFTEAGQSFTYASSAEDEEGGVIVAVYRGADIYAKRITSAGAVFNWGAASDQATDSGVLIRNGVTNPSIIPVYTGIIQKIRTGTTDMAYLLMPAYIYDHDDIFSSGLIVDNDVIMDQTNHDGTTITKTGQDHTYFIQQTANVIASGDTYFLADGTASASLSPSSDHDMNVLPDYTAGNDWVYSPHLALAPPAWIGAGDVIRSGASYGRIIAGSTSITVAGIDTLNNANSDTPFWIYDGAGTPFAAVVAGDLVQNTTTSFYAHVLTNVSDNELILDADIFTTASDNYAVYSLEETNNGSADIPNRMYKSGALAVNIGDYVQNTTSSSSFESITSVSVSDITLSGDIFSSTTENYTIWDATPLPGGEYTGTPNSVSVNHLIGTATTWASAPDLVSIGDLVYNATIPGFARVTGVTDTDLTLSAHIFTNTTDTYYIFQPSESGTANSIIPFKLYRGAATWTVFAFTSAQDIVERTPNNYAVMQNPITDTEITLDTSLFGSVVQGYKLYKRISTNTASSTVPFHMNRVGALWTTAPVVTVGDLVYNITDGTFATVSSINAPDDLTLSANIFDAAPDFYTIYHNFCTTHAGASAIDPFYSIQINWNINIIDTVVFSLYDYLGITGTADTAPVRPLYDNNPSAAFNGATAVAANDVVINYTATNAPNNPNVGTVTTGVYTIHAKALDMNHPGLGMFGDNEEYEIIRFLNLNTDSTYIIETGSATALIADSLRDVANNFTIAPVNVGDIVYNLTDDTYASVKTVAAATLTLSRHIFDTGNERYIVLRRKGLFYIWQEGANIRGRITSMGPAGSVPVDLVATYTIVAGSSFKAIPDEWGSVLLIYVNAAGQIQASRINGNGVITVAPNQVDTQIAVVESIIDVQSDGANGAIILYKYSNNLYVQRIDNSCVRLWGANGFTVENSADITSQEVMRIDPATKDVVIAANVANDIKAARVGLTSWGWQFIVNETSIQSNPAVYLNGANTLIFWTDERFRSTTSFSMGYGIFGVKIDASTGVKDALWNANSGGGTADTNGVSIIINYLQLSTPNGKLIPYNNGTGAIMTWEDYAPGQVNNLVYINPTVGLPW